MAENINFRFALIVMYQKGDLFHTLVAKNAFFDVAKITAKRKLILSAICFVGGDRHESWHFSLELASMMGCISCRYPLTHRKIDPGNRICWQVGLGATADLPFRCLFLEMLKTHG